MKILSKEVKAELERMKDDTFRKLPMIMLVATYIIFILAIVVSFGLSTMGMLGGC